MFDKKQAVSKVKDTELSFPRRWESKIHTAIWIPVFTGMTNKYQLLKQAFYKIIS